MNPELQINVFNSFIAFCSALSFLFFLGEIFSAKSNTRNFYLASVFLFLSLFLNQAFLWSSRLIAYYPHLLHVHMPATVLIGVFLERYLVLMWENQAEPINKFIYKSLACLLPVFFIVPFFLLSETEKLEYIRTAVQEGAPIRTKLAVVFVILIQFIFFYRLQRRFMKLFRSSTIYSSVTLRLILCILVIGFICIAVSSAYALNGKITGLEANAYIIGVFLIFLYIVRMRNPEIFIEVRKIVEEEKKYKNSQLKSVDLSKVGDKLQSLLEKEKIYREETISLPELASMIGISPHQLSEYLNQEMKISFFQLIHRYRIMEAKEKLISNPKETILSIAYSAGYQSKSTFNEIFKKETGLTPTEFRKKYKKSPNL